MELFVVYGKHRFKTVIVEKPCRPSKLKRAILDIFYTQRKIWDTLYT